MLPIDDIPHPGSLGRHLSRAVLCCGILFTAAIIWAAYSLWHTGAELRSLSASERQTQQALHQMNELLHAAEYAGILQFADAADAADAEQSLQTIGDAQQHFRLLLNTVAAQQPAADTALQTLGQSANAFFVLAMAHGHQPSQASSAVQLTQERLQVLERLDALRERLTQHDLALSGQIQRRAEHVLLALAVLLPAGLALLHIALASWTRRHISRPFLNIRSALAHLQQKRYDIALPQADAPQEVAQAIELLHLLRDAMRQADQLAQDAAAHVKERHAAEQVFRLSQDIPGIIFQMRVQADGGRQLQFLSRNTGALFGAPAETHGTDGPSRPATEESLEEQNAALPLSLYTRLWSALQLPAPPHNRPAALKFDAMVEHAGTTRWIRTLARVRHHADHSATINGLWIDVTDSLHQTEVLADAKTLAENLAREKASFLAMMGHEIRTPLNGILGMTQVALKGELSVPQRERVEKIYRSGKHLLGIVNDVLDYSKMDSGELAVEATAFSLQALLTDVGDLISPGTAEKGLEFWMEIGPEVPDQLVGDPYRIRQILLNYLSNAVKFTPAGEVVVRISGARRDAQSLLLRFDVCDTGIGISDDDQAKLFQAFKQTDASITRRYGGTGLGLAISRRLAGLLGGESGMSSAPGQGSIFWFTAQAGLATGQSAAPCGSMAALRILIAESHANARQALARLLAGTLPQAQVHAVSTGAQAQEAASRQQAAAAPYDIFLIASTLPDSDGLATASQLAQQAHADPRHIWLLLPSDDAVLHAQALQHGLAGTMPKPLTALRVCSAIRGRLAPPDDGGQPPAAVLPAATQHARQRLLVVDDNAINRAIAAELLQAAGVAVETAEHGAAAVALLEQRPAGTFDAILMDMQMPVMDGYTATGLIRAMPQCADTPIIALTAHLTSDETRRARECGIDGFIAKPVLEQDMWAVLRDRGIRPQPQADAPAAPVPDMPDAQPTPTDADTAAAALAFDAATWQELLQSLPAAKVHALCEQYLQHTSGRLRDIEQAFATQDWRHAQRLVHELGGNSGTFGLLATSTFAQHVETHLKDQRHAQAQALLPALLNVTAAGMRELKQRLDASQHGNTPATA